MPPSARTFLFLGSVAAGLAVIMGAFGAHALKAKIGPELIAAYQTGVQYHFYHALGLLAVALTAHRLPSSRFIRWAGWSMLLGIVLFSGSLYMLALTSTGWLGAITPFGGLAFMVGWALLAFGAIKGG